MDYLRGYTLTAISHTIAFTRFLQYCILFPFTPALESFLKTQFLLCDIKINGDRPWDIVVKDRRFYAQLIVYGPLGIGEAYLDSWWECQDLEEFFFKLVQKGILSRWYQMPWNRLANYLQWEWLNTQSKQRAKSSCNFHYNFGMDFFEHFLDTSMSYSVAYWKTQAKNLQEAQKAKMELVAQKLQLKPGMRVLDLGCGFGGLSKHLAENYGVKVVGITNSTKMGEAAEKKCEGLPVEIQITDWRDLQGTFDRIVCIEMVLHVGKHNLDEFFNRVRQWLKDDDGIFVMQDFSAVLDVFCSDDFMSKYFFPLAYCGRVDEIIKRAGPYLILEHYEDITLDGVKTCRAFFEAFDKCWPNISKDYDSKIYKAMKHFFLSGAAFSRAKRFLTHQMVFTKIP